LRCGLVDYERLTNPGIRLEPHFNIRTSGRIINGPLEHAMPVHIYCKSCDREFAPTAEKLMDMIRSALASKTETLVLHCEACARCESEVAARRLKQAQNVVRLMRCPEAGCPGSVCRLEVAD